MKTKMMFFAAMMLVASTAFAGMGGGMGGNGMPGRPGGSGPGAGMGPAGAMSLTVADDGTVLTIIRTPGDPAVPGSGTIELVAISPTGGTLWTWTAPGAIHDLEIGGSTVLVSSIDGDQVAEPGVPGSGQGLNSVLHALALSSGAELWTLEVEGRIMTLEPTASVIYAVVADHDVVEDTGIVPRGGMNGPGTGSGDITLYAISYQGVVSWTVDLNP